MEVALAQSLAFGQDPVIVAARQEVARVACDGFVQVATHLPAFASAVCSFGLCQGALKGLYIECQRGIGLPAERLGIDLKEPLNSLIRRKGWKTEVMKKVQAEVGDGADVLAVSLVHEGADLNVTISVTVENKPPQFGKRRKASTIGGRSTVDGPIKTGKTMAAKRRSGNR